MFDSADRIALEEVLFLYSIPDIYIEVISTSYENKIAAVKVESMISS